MPTRRKILMTGGASLLLLGSGLGGYVGTRSIARAQEPWQRAGQSFGDPRLDALAYAILAPNPHNRQPWLVRLEAEDSFSLFCDLDKRLPETDPPNRQITIGLGAFLELFRQAAAEKGFRADITPFPDGEPQPVLDDRPVAHVSLVADPATRPDPLFATTLERRSIKEAYAARAIDDQTLSQLLELAGTGNDGSGQSFLTSGESEMVDSLRNLTWRAWQVEYDVPRTHRESVDLMRIGAGEINASPDGIDMSGPMMEAMYLGGIISREKLSEKGSTVYNSGIDMYREILEQTRNYGWLVSAGNSRTDQLMSGMNWVRINQAATKLGLAMHPVSQILQEFPEMADLYREFHARVAVEEPARVQGLFRLGYGPVAPPSPRWPLESRLVDA
ncbi:hypothetical protein SAMN02745824_0952 [Parasphingorhabdus marina DSM 22363]|uniref:Nitroreductase family protein n=1 Tax=Parasphingorhabdus marina DSM 22363 TaxID=1123272 RepID=A0A1N6CTH3_9SPHN|nr:hypothetical protein [Parasphingorhabdus marina]SIN61766.1 hypothetical protein SAMN02745824_0952 [Parasphingorhabdus marina DSM 22363]